MDNLNNDNEIIELNAPEEETPLENTIILESEIKVKKKPKKEFFWHRLSKKGKIAIIVSGILIILLITGLLVYFLVIKKENKKPKGENENIVLQKDNYIYDNGKLKFLDSNDKVLGTYECENKNDSECYVAKLSNEDDFDLPVYVDKNKEKIVKTSQIYDNRYVFVNDGKLINLYDIEKKEIIDKLSLIKTGDIEENLVVLKDEAGKYGIVSFEDDYKTVLDYDYSYLGIISNSDIYVARDNDKYYLVDYTGESLSRSLSMPIKSFNNDYIVVSNNGDYYLYDYMGASLFEDAYDYIELYEDYIFVINDNKMDIYDKNVKKVNSSSIKIKADSYQKTYIFDDKLNLKEVNKAYTITITDGVITVLDENTKVQKQVNIYEAELSLKYDYVSYSDGTLQIYSDKEKTNLLGSYKCNNKNTINKDSTEFENCFIAKETNIVNENMDSAYIPILNDNYVFIKDSKDGSDVVIFYDLNASKVKAKYQAVDTGLGTEGITLISNVKSLIFAKNTDGNYGAITFKDNVTTGVIAFKENSNGTSKISYLGNYLLVVRSSVNYLYKTDGELVATSKFKIQDYLNNYLVVKDKGYLVYKMSSTESGSIISNELDYIKLYAKFYIGIKDKKLNVYAYEDAKTPLINETIEIKQNDLASSYELKEKTDEYVIAVKISDSASVEYRYNKNWERINEE